MFNIISHHGNANKNHKELLLFPNNRTTSHYIRKARFGKEGTFLSDLFVSKARKVISQW
jgi:hypothetical protein